jgi:Ulp1 family protease
MHMFSTFFFNKLFYDERKYNYNNVQAWTIPSKLKAWGQSSPSVLDCTLLVVPIHLTNHWTAAAVAL